MLVAKIRVLLLLFLCFFMFLWGGNPQQGNATPGRNVGKQNSISLRQKHRQGNATPESKAFKKHCALACLGMPCHAILQHSFLLLKQFVETLLIHMLHRTQKCPALKWLFFGGNKTPQRGNVDTEVPCFEKGRFGGGKKTPLRGNVGTEVPCFEKTSCFVDY